MSTCTLDIAPGIEVQFEYDPRDPPDCVEIESVKAGSIDITDFVDQEAVIDRMLKVREARKWEHEMGADRDY
jgi:hypothetical protein